MPSGEADIPRRPGREDRARVTPRPPFRSVKVRQHPATSAARLGEIRSGDEARLSGPPACHRSSNKGCSCWLRVAPAGYLCRDQVRPVGPLRAGAPRGEGPARYQYATIKSPRAPVFPRSTSGEGRHVPPSRWLRRGDGVTLVPAAGPDEARKPSVLVHTASRGSLRRRDISLVPPSAMRASDIAGLPPELRYAVAWVVPPLEDDAAPFYSRGPHAPVADAGPAGAGAAPRELLRYTEVFVLGPGTVRGRVLVRLPGSPRKDGSPGGVDEADGEVESDHLRRLLPPVLPADLRPGERWIDVSISQQVAAAYEGPLPLFATLVSTSPTATPSGSFAIYRKYRTQTLANLPGAASLYDYREVPFAQFFSGRFGFHAAPWHDHLGHAVSHGCVNLSPADAERFFSFTSPDLPAGWHAVTALAAPPGDPLVPAGTRVVVHR